MFKLKLDKINTRREQIEATKKMLEKIKLTSDNYNIDNKINYLIENNIEIKYLGRKLNK